jgi:starch synthase
MVSSEAVPFAKSGGLGDMVSSLAMALARLGHDVRMVIPRYYFIDKTKLARLEGPLGIPVGPKEQWAAVFEARLPGLDGSESGVPVYFIDHEGMFGRNGIYGFSSQQEFSDNPERFALLSRAAFQLCRKLKWIPDIFHAHDWPSALVPVFLSTLEKTGEFSDSSSVLTIHNLGYQGIYPKEKFPAFGLEWKWFHGSGFEYNDVINILQAGIHEADSLSTVSPTYAREIQTPAFGFGLDGLLRHRSRDLVGILNGIDTSVWNPETDPILPARYSSESMDGKAVCKAELQKLFGLEIDPDIPLFGMVARLTEQKGISELFGRGYGAVARIAASMKVQIVVVGSGDSWCEDELRNLVGRLPNFKAKIGYDESLAHLVEGGTDFFLMPSRYEPCGLNQLYSLRYGTLPVVHRTGGLADTVVNYDQNSGNGTGFMFDDLTPDAIFNTVGWATWAWYNRKPHIELMRMKAMSEEFSWEKSASEYTALYGRSIAIRKGR